MRVFFGFLHLKIVFFFILWLDSWRYIFLCMCRLVWYVGLRFLGLNNLRWEDIYLVFSS